MPDRGPTTILVAPGSANSDDDVLQHLEASSVVRLASEPEDVDDPIIEGVFVADIPVSDVAIRALEAGKPVLVGHEVATDSASLGRLANAARENGAHATWYHRCFAHHVERARNLVDNGEVGLPRIVQIQIVEPSSSNLRLTLMQGIDAVGWITGLDIVSSYGCLTEHEDPDLARAGSFSLEFERGVIATVAAGVHANGSLSLAGSSRIILAGSLGLAVLEEDRPSLGVASATHHARDRLPDGGPASAVSASLARDFVRTARLGSPPLRTLDDAAIALAVIDQAREG